MKKSVKILGITAVILCGSGILLQLIGNAFGGKEKIAEIQTARYHFAIEKQKLSTPTELMADLAHIDVSILPSTDENWYFSYAIDSRKKKNPLSIKEENGTLRLYERNAQETMSYEQSTLFGIHKQVVYNSELTLYIPKNTTLNTCNLKLGDGCLVLQDVNTKTLQIGMKDGDADISHVQADRFSITTAAGDITAYAFLGKHGKITTDYGDISLTTEKDLLQNINISALTELGDITLSYPFAQSGTLKEDDNDSTLYQKSGTTDKWEIISESGDITLQDMYAKADTNPTEGISHKLEDIPLPLQ